MKTEANFRDCPKCGSPMILTTTADKGKWATPIPSYWACRDNWPVCKHVIYVKESNDNEKAVLVR